ncbi:hypothetical protein [Bifidobacterium simiarum]|uniref:Uncharacterized protein n=1 Tax=Bifidobacterium simiarum TaxID=2045441 RepID=A0A2M9HDK7_9BIFI|nr:hypothetical protein [Bifidobacterium simiarum]PJM74892.1 hypothetical protein CSQ87_08085 [Bifidobacterium simiarum]
MSEINPKNQQEAQGAQRGADEDREEPALFDMPPLKPVEPDHVVLDMPSVDDDFDGSDNETMVLDGVGEAVRAMSGTSDVPAPPHGGPRVTIHQNVLAKTDAATSETTKHDPAGRTANGADSDHDAADKTGTGETAAESAGETTVVFKPTDTFKPEDNFKPADNAPDWHHAIFHRRHHDHDDQHSEERARRHRRHVMVMRGIVTPALALLAVAAIVLGWLNMTIWKPNPNVSVSSKVSTRYTVTDPGVLALADNTVSVKADTSAASSVCIAVASPRDAAGWLANQHYTRVTGLDTWKTFSTETADGTTAGDANKVEIAFQQSDMWYAVQCGKGSATLKWKDSGDDKVVLVDLGSGSENPTGTVDMAWTRAKVPDFATPCFFVGGLLAVMAILTASLFAVEQHRRRNRKARTVESTPVAVAAAPEPEPTEPPAWMRPGSEPPAPSGRSRRRRHSHTGHTRRAQEAVETQTNEPEVSDATSVNLLQQSTPTVSSNELEEYFARLRAESAANAATTADSVAESGPVDDDSAHETHTDDADKEAK